MSLTHDIHSLKIHIKLQNTQTHLFVFLLFPPPLHDPNVFAGLCVLSQWKQTDHGAVLLKGQYWNSPISFWVLVIEWRAAKKQKKPAVTSHTKQHLLHAGCVIFIHLQDKQAWINMQMSVQNNKVRPPTHHWSDTLHVRTNTHTHSHFPATSWINPHQSVM